MALAGTIALALTTRPVAALALAARPITGGTIPGAITPRLPLVVITPRLSVARTVVPALTAIMPPVALLALLGIALRRRCTRDSTRRGRCGHRMFIGGAGWRRGGGPLLTRAIATAATPPAAMMLVLAAALLRAVAAGPPDLDKCLGLGLALSGRRGNRLGCGRFGCRCGGVRRPRAGRASNDACPLH